MPSNLDNYRIIAVSGGVDSVVLLHKMMHEAGDRSNTIVAHVDHGIRADSAHDAVFVRSLAQHYGVTFRGIGLKLGAQASEERAREARYQFLRGLAKHYGEAPIYTAHHADDVIESVAINLIRGTGWRGLAGLGAVDIERPLSLLFKEEIIAYAKKHKLQWREDSTNTTDAYLRNRIRRHTQRLSYSQKCELLALWKRQQELRGEIERECQRLATDQRYFYIMSDESSAIEVLRSFLATHKVSATRPQLLRLLYAIKSQKAQTLIDIANGKSLKIDTQNISLAP